MFISFARDEVLSRGEEFLRVSHKAKNKKEKKKGKEERVVVDRSTIRICNAVSKSKPKLNYALPLARADIEACFCRVYMAGFNERRSLFCHHY